MRNPSVINRLSYLGTSRKVSKLEELTLGQGKFKFTTGALFEYKFSKRYGTFTKVDYSNFSDRKTLLEEVTKAIGSVPHRITSVSGKPFKVHFFGQVIEVMQYDYVVRSGLLFDPTLLPEGKTQSVLRDEYFHLLFKLNEGNSLNIFKLEKGSWQKVDL